MSGESSEEKTEQPSDRKLKKAREKGNVPTSRETISSILTAVALLYLFARRDAIGLGFQELFLIGADPTLPFSLQLRAKTDLALDVMAAILLPLFALVLAVGILTGYAISGPVFSAHALNPDFNKINPVSGFKKIFGRKALMTFLMHFIRVFSLLAVLAVLYWQSFGTLMGSAGCGLECQMPTLWQIVIPMLATICGLMVAFAILDFAVQRAEFMREQKMSISEVKREHKDIDGDPHLKGQLRNDRRDMLESPTGLGRATVVIHAGQRSALAVRYVEGETPAPLVVARAAGRPAVSSMRRRAKVLVVQDDNLLDMIGKIAVGDYIVEEAQILHLATHLQHALQR